MSQDHHLFLRIPGGKPNEINPQFEAPVAACTRRMRFRFAPGDETGLRTPTACLSLANLHRQGPLRMAETRFPRQTNSPTYSCMLDGCRKPLLLVLLASYEPGLKPIPSVDEDFLSCTTYYHGMPRRSSVPSLQSYPLTAGSMRGEGFSRASNSPGSL